jgi:hypothetical protein
MWTDINIKLKEGLVFHVFRGQVMGIPVDYKDADYKGKVPLLPKVSMLPLTKEQLALQECEGRSEKRCAPTQVGPTQLGIDWSWDRQAEEERLDVASETLLRIGLN